MSRCVTLCNVGPKTVTVGNGDPKTVKVTGHNHNLNCTISYLFKEIMKNYLKTSVMNTLFFTRIIRLMFLENTSKLVRKNQIWSFWLLKVWVGPTVAKGPTWRVLFPIWIHLKIKVFTGKMCWVRRVVLSRLCHQFLDHYRMGERGLPKWVQRCRKECPSSIF